MPEVIVSRTKWNNGIIDRVTTVRRQVHEQPPPEFMRPRFIVAVVQSALIIQRAEARRAQKGKGA